MNPRRVWKPLVGLLVSIIICIPGQPASPAATVQSPEEKAGRPAVRLAAQAIRGVYQFYNGGGPDGRMVQFQNLNTNNDQLEARFFDKGTVVQVIEFAKVSLPHRVLTFYDPPLDKPSFQVAIYRKNVACQKREVSAPAIINITGTCTLNIVPIKQTMPAALAAVGATRFLGRYKAGTDKLTYVIAQTPTHLLISFVGTENIPENILLNLDGMPSLTNPGFLGVPTHKGWTEAVDELLPLILRFTDAWRGSRALYITGFSMGGAVSGHLTYRLMDAQYKGTLRLVTFGAPRYALQKFKDEFYSRAGRVDLQAFSVEFPNDPKRFEWKIAVEKIAPQINMDVLRIGHVVDYSCEETANPSECQSDPHNYRRYAEVAERRYGLR